MEYLTEKIILSLLELSLTFKVINEYIKRFNNTTKSKELRSTNEPIFIQL
jgi:hypothetical protein